MGRIDAEKERIATHSLISRSRFGPMQARAPSDSFRCVSVVAIACDALRQYRAPPFGHEDNV
ncbi:hypothetical protein C6P86_01215 [Burkholderia multivorans]|nr:hypothetical protein C6P78_29350 [Burkholderia multivorans]PRE74012.1 hypothetical protein C6P86_01215 [Burkholderia multivorans]PRE87767.1 hypothetical protein C6Q00_10985 [Burkholderia multivorans]PRG20042.1 hypothetical protein C6T57_19970 [Burkholderia multivorans]